MYNRQLWFLFIQKVEPMKNLKDELPVEHLG